MRNTKEEILKKYFGYDNFRSGQEEVIDSILSGRDVMCIMPTGAGKSMCYQLPALAFEGVTIVVSPLISLMKDQVQSLVNCGVKAAYVNSSLSPQVVEKVLARASAALYKIIYVAPERLNTFGFLNAIKPLNISLVVVDEAHCISRWGHDFRPSYLEIVKFIGGLPRRPVLGAFTATATQPVKEDICKILDLNSPFVKVTTFDRPNLFFDVRQPKSKSDELMAILKGREKESGIVYCATRKKVEEVCDFLVAHGVAATRYHAGLDDEERIKNQDEFTYDTKRVMVATNAFGMGVDKGNVSFVVHYNMPKDMESYYQEAGRAGRDGNRADCILLYGDGDIYTNKFIISQAESEGADVGNAYKLLNRMTDYCKTAECLRGFILSYFGEKHAESCGNCGNCCGDNFEKIDATAVAGTVVRCIRHLPRQFGKSVVISVLQGGKGDRIDDYGLSLTPEYGALKALTRRDIGTVIDNMLTVGYLEQNGDEFPVLQVCEGVEEEELTLFISVRKKREKSGKEKTKGKAAASAVNLSDGLYIRLKDLRFEIAKREGVPAYIIFSDATLADMCVKRPQTAEEFLNVTGVGQIKCDRYSREFIKEIKKFSDEGAR